MPVVFIFDSIYTVLFTLCNSRICKVLRRCSDLQSSFRTKDWGPAPRWVAFVDFFLASHAKHAVVSGAHRRVGTTYAQLIAALAAASQLGVLKAIQIFDKY